MGLSAGILLFFPVIPVMVLAVMLVVMALAALPLTWLTLWLAPPAWLRDIPLSTLFPACMLAAPVLFLALVAVAAPARDVAEAEKPTMEQVRERQALFRHLLPNRAQPQD